MNQNLVSDDENLDELGYRDVRAHEPVLFLFSSIDNVNISGGRLRARQNHSLGKGQPLATL
jgi:hypothetical protein